MLRLSHADPCELREVPVARTLSTLRASTPWRRYRRFLVAAAPVDVWREGCWRFVVFPGVLASRRVEVVFAVYLACLARPVRVGMLDTGTATPPVRAVRGPATALSMYKENAIQRIKSIIRVSREEQCLGATCASAAMAGRCRQRRTPSLSQLAAQLA